MDLRPFARDDVPWAAALLASRPLRHPLAAPPDAAREIEALLDAGATGWAAPGGYALGLVDADAGWLRYAGHCARDVATYRHLYAAVSRDLVAAGALRHAVEMPDGDPVAGEAFANLAFGREHVFALASMDAQPVEGEPDARVRVGSLDDYDALLPLFPLLARHLAEPACWSPRPEAYFETLPALFREDMDSPDVTYLVAEAGGEPVGFATWEPLPARICVAEGAWALGHMVLREDARGLGLGAAMTLRGLTIGRERGFDVSWTDWRLTNLSAEPRWRTYGWAPYMVRMTRRLEPGVS
ncbi:MAG TPA: GNAT family N-acetyltransferase [Frankiaceae bacterium]|nr:GNAT family N-acetyltransferase [Frankiaceae bacterium]